VAVVYHRIAEEREKHDVITSGVLWGRAPRMNQGNHLPSVKAYIGHLPDGAKGYSFMTDLPPTTHRHFFGKPGVMWVDGSPGVNDVKSQHQTVCIAVQVL
jgi:hypothetical protein